MTRKITQLTNNVLVIVLQAVAQFAGVKMYISQKEVIKLFNPNMYRELLLVDGIVDFSCDSYLTKI